jgi:hypothetical protein
MINHDSERCWRRYPVPITRTWQSRGTATCPTHTVRAGEVMYFTHSDIPCLTTVPTT